MKWIPGYKKDILPPDDSHEDFQKLYVCRFKGDDPRSGWVDIKLYAAYVMREMNYDDYWEWLDESKVGEGDAVEFAEWAYNNYKMYQFGIWRKPKELIRFTTTELYQKFKQSKGTTT